MKLTCPIAHICYEPNISETFGGHTVLLVTYILKIFKEYTNLIL